MRPLLEISFIVGKEKVRKRVNTLTPGRVLNQEKTCLDFYVFYIFEFCPKIFKGEISDFVSFANLYNW